MFYQGFQLPAAPYRGQTSGWCQREKQENLPGHRTTDLVQLSVPFVTSQGADFQTGVAVQAPTFKERGTGKRNFQPPQVSSRVQLGLCPRPPPPPPPAPVPTSRTGGVGGRSQATAEAGHAH